MKWKNYSLQLIVTVLLMTVLLFMKDTCVKAEGGQGQDEPLQLVECNVYDGMVNAPVNFTISMRFTKNVADLTVRDQNASGISLTAQDGSGANYNIYFPDDFDNRNWIHLNVNLNSETTYTLHLSTSIMARNGINFLCQDYYITFTTEGTQEIEEETTVPEVSPEINQPQEEESLDPEEPNNEGESEEQREEQTKPGETDVYEAKNVTAEQENVPDTPVDKLIKDPVLADVQSTLEKPDMQKKWKVYSIANKKTHGKKNRQEEKQSLKDEKTLNIMLGASMAAVFIFGMAGEYFLYRKRR